MSTEPQSVWARRKEKYEVIELVIRTIAIFIAGFWVAWTFVYQEVSKPKKAPAPIQTNLSLKVLGKTEGAWVVGATLEVKNTGGRRVDMLPSIFVASAFSAEKDKPSEGDFENLFKDTLSGDSVSRVMSRFVKYTQPAIVAVKRLFLNWDLSANEVRVTTFVFEVPADKGGYLSGNVQIPTVSNSRDIDFRWCLVKDKDNIRGVADCTESQCPAKKTNDEGNKQKSIECPDDEEIKAMEKKCSNLLQARGFELYRTDVEIPLSLPEPRPPASAPEPGQG